MKKIVLTLILLVLILSACQTQAEEELVALEGEPFEIYLVADAQITGSDLGNYDLDQLPLAQMPIISTADLVSYDLEYHGINLTEDAYLRLLTIFMVGLPSSGVPFVLKAYEQPLFAGAFWSPYSLLSFDGVVIVQPLDPAGQTLYLELGYPTEANFTGEDPRANPRLQQAIENEGLIRE